MPHANAYRGVGVGHELERDLGMRLEMQRKTLTRHEACDAPEPVCPMRLTVWPDHAVSPFGHSLGLELTQPAVGEHRVEQRVPDDHGGVGHNALGHDGQTGAGLGGFREHHHAATITAMA